MKWQPKQYDWLPVGSCGKYDQVRTYEDVLGQLVTLYVTGIVAYIHLLWIRGESVLDWRPIFFPFSPLAVVIQHVFAILAIFFRFVKAKVKPEQEPFDIRISLRILFGRVPPTDDTAATTTGPIFLPEKKSTQEPPPADEFSNILSSAKALGLFVQFSSLVAYLAYCVLSTKLFLRRHSHDPSSLANADYTAVQLSIGGIFLALLTLPHTPLTALSVFTSPVPHHNRTPFTRALLFFRDSSAPTLYSPRYSPYLFSYLQQYRQLFYLEAIPAVLSAFDFGTLPPMPLNAIVNNYDSFGAIPLPQLPSDYHWRETGGRAAFALFMLHALRSAVRGRRLWEKDALEAQEALLEPPTATATESSTSPDEAYIPEGEEGSRARRAWRTVLARAQAFLADPLAYSPSVSTLFPYIMVGACAMNVADRVWPELRDWEMWPLDVPCPQQWRDPFVREWEWVWRWWDVDFLRFGH
ncbi:hypothetical protein UCRNP2_2826 [Neofusicoccum parvum UCRNP2]|uniref:Uncharacterized protein n=1 Tax=Botryosphaeria parva (strain UCR-NP2) TaxID=1287680 RepID=R1ERJ7_BOTPV|nr:hypothetical protein UCRNP2_2826 [Neofusicoccum parvum UCRNP2]